MASRRVDPRARSAGLGAKLHAYFDEIEQAQERGESGTGDLPENPTRLAWWLTVVRKKKVTNFATLEWWKSRGLPHSWYVPDLEDLLEGPWWWILDPKTKWEAKGPMRALYKKTREEALTAAGMARAASRFASEARAAPARPPRR